MKKLETIQSKMKRLKAGQEEQNDDAQSRLKRQGSDEHHVKRGEWY